MINKLIKLDFMYKYKKRRKVTTFFIQTLLMAPLIYIPKHSFTYF